MTGGSSEQRNADRVLLHRLLQARVELVEEAVGGKRGGRPDMTPAGGPDGGHISDALTAIEKAVAAKASS
jgi:alanyl-tRNA synthetase